MRQIEVPRPRRRALSERDRAAWASYVQHVVPRAGVAVPVEPPAAPASGRDGASIAQEPLPVAVPAATRPARHLPPLEVGAAPGGVDRASWTRFRSGKLVPERTLDLHGRTAQRAHAALLEFMARAQADRLRCVEVITGRGTGEAGGVIRRELPMWLNGPGLRPLVLAASHPHPANPGAVRLLLRRVR